MKKVSLVATLTVALSLIVASVASAHHVDAVSSTASCTGVTAKFSGFNTRDGDVTWGIKVDNVPVANGVIPAFNGDKTYPVTYSNALQGPGSHTVVFLASWPTKGNNNGTFTKTVTGCPEPPKLPCPNEPPTAPCNCPPGEKGDPGKDGITTTVVIEKTIVVQQPPATCTSQRSYAFRVRKTYNGHRVVGVKAFEAGQHPVVRKVNGRRVVKWSTKGQVFPKGGVLKVMGVIARLDNGKYVRLRYFYRPCAPKNGNPNDDSAVATPVSSQAKSIQNAEAPAS